MRDALRWPWEHKKKHLRLTDRAELQMDRRGEETQREYQWILFALYYYYYHYYLLSFFIYLGRIKIKAFLSIFSTMQLKSKG